MRISASIICLLLLVSLKGISQEDSVVPYKKSFIKLYAISGNVGFATFDRSAFGYHDYRKITPSSALLSKDLSKYAEEPYRENEPGIYLNLTGSFIFYSKQQQKHRNNQELRIGISYQNSNTVENTYTLDERVRFDTLRSNTSPKEYYIDTVKLSRLSVSNLRENLMLEIAHTFHSKQNRVFSYYIGYSIGYGWMTANTTHVSYNYREEFRDQNNKAYFYTESSTSKQYAEETNRLSRGQVYQAAIPVGMVLRFSKSKLNQVKRLALNIDTRSGIKISEIMNFGNYTQYFFNMNFGIKYYLHKESLARRKAVDY